MDNQTVEVSSPCHSLGQSFLVCGLIFIAGTLLLSVTFNGLILLSFYLDATLRTLSCAFIINLAVTDVISSIILIPMEIIYLVHFPWIPFSGTVNNVWNAVFLSLLAASILNFTAVSLDRYIRIRYPLHYMYYLTQERVMQLLIFIWSYALVIGVLMFFAFDEPVNGVYSFQISALFFIPFLLINVLLPFCIIIVLYIRIFRIMRRHMRCINVQVSARIRACHFVPVRRQNSLLQNLSSSKTVCLVLFGFSLTWFPFLIYQLFYMYSKQSECLLDKFDTVICWLTYFSAVSNPVIYAAREKRFKKVILRLLDNPGRFNCFANCCRNGSFRTSTSK
ncbi:histamine H2 receptor-like [Actinia tenebrosa]|uniref:Histamine H2 receptor-like n=1 Tax=Actinia tenebrosa TaxID=6105 RepID=A0A6P8H5F4_ACTTE|nr:histamine H2 receptor-like [Actinia tenebrosa]